MPTSINASCIVAIPIECNSATLSPIGATGGATTLQPTGLKALAKMVLHRNQWRNPTVTCQKTDRNFSAESVPHVVITIADEIIPEPCRGCSQVEVLTIMDEAVPGCLYRAEGEFSEGWKRLSENLKICFHHH